MNTTLSGLVVSIGLFFGGILLPASPSEPRLRGWHDGPVTVIPDKLMRAERPRIEFRHGDISWLPELAAEAGWPEKTWPRLGEIILRESGGCPNRRGGDVVNENCEVTDVSDWSHRSDSGLLQINGVNYNPKRNKWAAICREMDVCEQDPLLDPLTNLKAGYVLFQISGWDPWNPCAWGPDHRPKSCNKKP